MLEELMAHVVRPTSRAGRTLSLVFTSAVMVAAWGYFLLGGVHDPLGGINSLWPLFGISNQLLATIALCVATTILIKTDRRRFAWVTLAPLAWLVTVTMTASYQKVWSPNPRLGFLAHANTLSAQLAAGSVPAAHVAEVGRLAFNDRLDAMVTLIFATLVVVVLAESARQWWLYLRGRKPCVLTEAPAELSRLPA